MMLARERDRLHSALRAQGRMAAPLQQIVEELHVQLVILYNEDGTVLTMAAALFLLVMTQALVFARRPVSTPILLRWV